MNFYHTQDKSEKADRKRKRIINYVTRAPKGRTLKRKTPQPEMESNNFEEAFKFQPTKMEEQLPKADDHDLEEEE